MPLSRFNSIAVVLLGFVVLAMAPLARASCGAAFCTLNTQWDTQGVWTEPGLRADLRFEYVDQDQLRAGRHKVNIGEISRHHDEVRTINRNWIASFDYTLDPQWGITAQLPIVDRHHDHIHNHHGAQLPEVWNFSGLGDARVLARYQFAHDAHHTDGASGLLFGLKLPTGNTDERNQDGDLAERTLQPGTGTTDATLGIYANTQFLLNDRPAHGFIQGRVQSPLNEHDNFEPGAQYSIDTGLSYPFDSTWTGLLQANLEIKKRDRGTQAEPNDSGGTFLYLSPGLNYALSAETRLYGFVQWPLYQRVNGVQLTADWAVAVGANWRF